MYSWALSLTTLSFSFFIWKMVKLIVSQSRLQGSNENFNMCFWDIISCWSKRYNSNQIKYMGVFINSWNRELKVQGWLRHGWMGAFSAYIQNLLLLQLLALLDFGLAFFSNIFCSCVGKDDHWQQAPNLPLSKYSEKSTSLSMVSAKVLDWISFQGPGSCPPG